MLDAALANGDDDALYTGDPYAIIPGAWCGGLVRYPRARLLI
jgi:hypothetical protein